MAFNSIPFLVLFVTTYALCQLVGDIKKKKMVLLLSSYVFYAYWDVRFLFLMIFAEYVCYILALKISRKRNKLYLVAGLVALLGILVVFKYAEFLCKVLNVIVGEDILVMRNIVLPIGISFYTFQCISYLIDVWRGETETKTNFWELSLFISFFPQLVAGPIMRAKDFLPQLDGWSKESISKDNLISGCQIFLFGLFKKVVIADRLAVCVDSVFEAPNAYSGFSILCASASYALQILCDFSGYSDMAIGAAKVFGFDLCKNFNLPYLATNPSDFWRRWHISLSQWLRDYLYIPLGGNRKGKIRTNINLLITMLLGGLWHGASLNFIIWGGLHGLALVLHKIYSKTKIQHFLSTRGGKVYSVICIILNNVFVILAWIVFRLNSFEDIRTVFVRIFTMADGIQYIYVYSVIFASLTVLYYYVGHVKYKGVSWYTILDLSSFWQLTTLFIFIWIIVLFGYSGDNAFIYFQF